MKEHLESDSRKAYPSLVGSTVQHVDGGISSHPIVFPRRELSRCGPEDLRNHTGKAVAPAPQKSIPHTPTNRNSRATTHHNGRHSLNDRGLANVQERSDEQSKCRRLSAKEAPRSGNTSSEKKFRSAENLLSGGPGGMPESSRPTSAANSRPQGSLFTGTGRTPELKGSGHRRGSETGGGDINRIRSRSIDASSSGSAPRSRSVEVRSRTPLRSSVSVGSRPSPSVSRISCEPVTATAGCDTVAEKQMVILSRPGAKRQSVTTLMTESSSTVPQRNGLQRKLSSGRLSMTADKLLPNYQPKRKLQSSVSLDASVVDYSNGSESGDPGKSRILHESATMPLLSLTFDDYPEPPPPEEDLNERMELLFEEYRKVELGLIFKNKQQEEPEEPKQLDKQRPIDRGRRGASVDRRRPVSSAQNPRARSVSRDRSSLTESRTSRKEMPWTGNARSDPVKYALRDSRTLTKALGSNQANSKTHAGSVCVSTARPSSSLAAAPSCPLNSTQPVVKGAEASIKSTKTLEDVNDLRDLRNKSSDNLQHFLGNQTGKHTNQKRGSEPKVPTRDPSLTRNMRRNSASLLSPQTTENCSGTIARGNTRSSRDTSSRSTTTTGSHQTPNQSHVPPKNLGHRRVTLPDLTTTMVRKPTKTIPGSIKSDTKNEQLNGIGNNAAASAVTTARTEKSDDLCVEEKGVAASIKATIRRDEKTGRQSKIPVPVYSKKFYSGSPRSLKRCDSGVDVANSYQSEAGSTGRRISHDEELKSNAPLILNPATPHLIGDGCTATNTPADVEDEYY